MTLTSDARRQAAQEAAAAREAVWTSKVDETISTGAVPDGYVVMIHSDPNARISSGRPLAPAYPGFWLLKKEDVEAASSHGFRVASLPASTSAQE
jgi:hypothetical protein